MRLKTLNKNMPKLNSFISWACNINNRKHKESQWFLFFFNNTKCYVLLFLKQMSRKELNIFVSKIISKKRNVHIINEYIILSSFFTTYNLVFMMMIIFLLSLTSLNQLILPRAMNAKKGFWNIAPFYAYILFKCCPISCRYNFYIYMNNICHTIGLWFNNKTDDGYLNDVNEGLLGTHIIVLVIMHWPLILFTKVWFFLLAVFDNFMWYWKLETNFFCVENTIIKKKDNSHFWLKREYYKYLYAEIYANRDFFNLNFEQNQTNYSFLTNKTAFNYNKYCLLYFYSINIIIIVILIIIIIIILGFFKINKKNNITQRGFFFFSCNISDINTETLYFVMKMF